MVSVKPLNVVSSRSFSSRLARGMSCSLRSSSCTQASSSSSDFRQRVGLGCTFSMSFSMLGFVFKLAFKLILLYFLNVGLDDRKDDGFQINVSVRIRMA